MRSLSGYMRLPQAVGSAALLAALLAVLPPLPTAAYADLPPNTVCQLPATSSYTGRPWAQARLDFERAWPLTTGGGIKVAVVDTGVDARQPALSGHVLPGIDEVNGNHADTDCDGHGTLVAGIIGAKRRTGIDFAGVAPDVTILPVRQADNHADGTTDHLAAAIRDAVDDGAQVINVSIVAPTPTRALVAAVKYALAQKVVIVAAAGNDAQQGDQPQYPAALPGVLSVGAIGADGQPASFSSTGSPVSVVAPGAGIVGPGAGGTGFVSNQGTSFAAPYVTGVVALVRAYLPHLTPAQIVHRIEATADHPAGALPDRHWGWGVVNPYAALTAVLPEEGGAKAVAQAPGQARPQPVRAVRDRTAETALGLAGGGAALAVLLPMVAVAVRRIRARGGPVPVVHGGGR